jgi:predicted phage terminase large subunit-like protein
MFDPAKAKAQLCRIDFHYFVGIFWNVIISEDYIDNWHIKEICDELQIIVTRVKNREPKLYDIVINVPPGSSKSTICTVMLPVWCWLIDESLRTLTASYSGSLSMNHSVLSRDIIKSPLFKKLFPEIQIRKDFDNKTHYKNTKGGERYATSVTGSVTGFHAHLLIVDDPLNPKEAVSQTERKRANDFMDNTLSTRKVDKSVTPTILVMQRLHEDDCTGHWIKQQKIGKALKHICLPAEISNEVRPEIYKQYYTEGLLDIVRMSKPVLEDLKISLGSYGYAGQMMQSPAPADGGIWKDWFIPITFEDLSKIKLQQLGSDWDLAYTKNEGNSATAYVTAGTFDKKMYITDIGFQWLEFPEMMRYIKTKTNPHYIEAKASGLSAKQSLKKAGIPAIEVKMGNGDKEARARMSTPYAESGLIYVLDTLIDTILNDDRQGILKFPNNTNNDLADALAQSISRVLIKKKSRVKSSGLI